MVAFVVENALAQLTQSFRKMNILVVLCKMKLNIVLVPRDHLLQVVFLTYVAQGVGSTYLIACVLLSVCLLQSTLLR